MPDLPFAELLGRSCFSFLEGASHPDELYLRAHQVGLAAFALCDRDGLYGSARLYQAARELAEAHPDVALPRVIVGAELTLEPEGRCVETFGEAKARIAEKIDAY